MENADYTDQFEKILVPLAKELKAKALEEDLSLQTSQKGTIACMLLGLPSFAITNIKEAALISVINAGVFGFKFWLDKKSIKAELDMAMMTRLKVNHLKIEELSQLVVECVMSVIPEENKGEDEFKKTKKQVQEALGIFYQERFYRRCLYLISTKRSFLADYIN